MTKDEALRLAEEALIDVLQFMGNSGVRKEALAAIRAALVESVDTSEECVDETVECGHEPVAVVDEVATRLDGTKIFNAIGNVEVGQKLYAAPVEPVKQEPVAWRTFEGECGCYAYRGYEDNEDYRDVFIKRNGQKYASWVEPLYTAPQPRQDVDLTDDDYDALLKKCRIFRHQAEAVIAKYKDKNK